MTVYELALTVGHEGVPGYPEPARLVSQIPDAQPARS